ncbi:hypothetical protein C5C07_19215 [Haloferax sp. Atlit-4N]|uniref:hypothetical protein n=1 Tax=Haloferax sp. Atlit-4N TaxID=2077206 RepID=UPI000E24A246|nr:hypothetical protein [Haloferax sp. Atlit-4N]RDZ50453.1 hypothetical protein C5C07_19215 [Haloferax sp. Atlit-4N]
MASFVEALLKERLWFWLEAVQGFEVEGEVWAGKGRIDLVARTPDGEFWGIELKHKAETTLDSRLYSQLHRYHESGMFDRIFLASPFVDDFQQAFYSHQPLNISIVSQTSQKLAAGIKAEMHSESEILEALDAAFSEEFLSQPISGSPSVREYIISKLGYADFTKKKPITVEQGISELTRARFPTMVGVIHIPLNLDGNSFRDVAAELTPNDAYEPQILREGEQLNRTGEPSFSRREEPWIRHCCWREFGGIPEAHVPNVMDSDRAWRPADLIAFSGSHDPTDAVNDPDTNEIIGIEAKGESSYNRTRVTQQLSELLATETLSRLYLAVPSSLVTDAHSLIKDHGELEKVGLLTVSEDGVLSIDREAARVVPVHDGYMEKYTAQKVGYGEVEIENGKEVVEPFVTNEEAERLKNPDAAAYARQLLTDNSDRADDDGWIRSPVTEPTEPFESEFNQTKVRAYLLSGQSADPYTEDLSQGVGPRDMKEGYVRLTISDLDVDGEKALKFHFGRGSWEGGYIWFGGDVIRQLLAIIVSIKTISGGEVAGQGKLLDLDTYPFDHDRNEPYRLSGASGTEIGLKLLISNIDDGNHIMRIRLGERKNEGVDVSFTEAQWLDLIATVDILLTGTHRELPGSFTTYPRIGPSGKDTWSIGTVIEEQVHPNLPSGF